MPSLEEKLMYPCGRGDDVDASAGDFSPSTLESLFQTLYLGTSTASIGVTGDIKKYVSKTE